jgi:hypothetical protein
VGSSIESETWQPGKVIANKLNTNITYPAATNYWTPLYKNDDKEEPKEEIQKLQQSTKAEQQPKSNKWTQRIERRQDKQKQQKEQSIVIDLGATSHFMSGELDLPKTGASRITVYLPDDSTLQATNKTQLPGERRVHRKNQSQVATINMEQDEERGR